MAEISEETARSLFEEWKRLDEETPADFNIGTIQLGSYRHKCTKPGRPAAQAPTKAIDLKEERLTSEDGKVAAIWKEGKCKSCNRTARGKPLYVDPAERPALTGRVSRS
jgi:hypothetical protein